MMNEFRDSVDGRNSIAIGAEVKHFGTKKINP